MRVAIRIALSIGTVLALRPSLLDGFGIIVSNADQIVNCSHARIKSSYDFSHPLDEDILSKLIREGDRHEPSQQTLSAFIIKFIPFGLIKCLLNVLLVA